MIEPAGTARDGSIGEPRREPKVSENNKETVARRRACQEPDGARIMSFNIWLIIALAVIVVILLIIRKKQQG